ncbi:MAG: hypothetical protein EOP06_25470 [Proteobacteria bacterium]|nr:MAG: hypothetical protein EOP06_25470 [Pseudomonadota bacterium]
MAQSWGGNLTVESELGKGSTFRIDFPRANTPSPLCETINIAPSSTVVVLDDDQAIHIFWQKRLSSIGFARLEQFTTIDAFKIWFKVNADREITCLFDNNLKGSEETGVALITSLGLEDRSYLVTSNFDDSALQSFARKTNLRILPKAILSRIKINHATTRTTDETAIVLLDNDKTMHLAWSAAAKRHNISIRLFSRASDLLSDLTHIPKDVNFYLDLNLDADDLDGISVARKLHNEGYTNLYVSTGAAANRVEAPPFIKGIVGKTPPWLK